VRSKLSASFSLVAVLFFTFAGFKVQAGTSSGLTRPQKWGLAVSGVLAQRNGFSHDLLSLGEKNIDNVKAQSEMLTRDWDVDSRESLYKTLAWIENEGHRKGFEEGREKVKATSDKEFNTLLEHLSSTNQEAYAILKIVKEYGEKLGDKSLLGWDYSRYIYLCRAGYTCGYLSEDEAWRLIFPVARKMQKTFSSWDDLGMNYLIGRAFWQAKPVSMIDDTAQAYYHLLTSADSPWKTLPWNIDLSGQ